MPPANVGDTKTSPLDYYTFPLPVEKRDMTEDLSGLEDAFIILGGGGIIHIPSPDYNNGVIGHLKEIENLGKRRVIWGAGHNVHFDPPYSGTCIPPKLSDNAYNALKIHPDLSTYELIGLRDFYYPFKDTYVPCVSCKDKVFLDKFPTGSGTGAVLHQQHANKTVYPEIYCEQSPFEEVIEFIKSFQTIVTDSFHAMYWTELMDKEVILHNVRSTKFLLHKRTTLQECIKLNDSFYHQVLRCIDNYD